MSDRTEQVERLRFTVWELEAIEAAAFKHEMFPFEYIREVMLDEPEVRQELFADEPKGDRPSFDQVEAAGLDGSLRTIALDAHLESDYDERNGDE